MVERMFDLQRAWVWHNGRVVPAAEVRLSPFDQGLTVGMGAFETLVSYGGKVFAFSRHWERLARSCVGLGLPLPDRPLIAGALEAVMEANGLPEARLRVTLTPGAQLPAATWQGKGEVTVLVTAVPRPQSAPLARVALLPDFPRSERSPLAGFKTTSYAENLLAWTEAQRQGAHEALLPNLRGEVCEGSTSNVFLGLHGVLVTPPLSAGCLPGVTRALVLQLAQEAGVAVQEAPVPWAALLEAEEAFLTSTTREIQPISHWDERPLPAAPGPLTRRLQAAWAVMRECGEIDP